MIQKLNHFSSIFKLSRIVSINVLLAFLCFLYSHTGFGQSYIVGHQLYEKGDLNGAVTALKKALENRNSKTDQAKIHKLIGICQFMLGNQSIAAGSFKEAIQFDPNIKISSNEVLDQEVVKFFVAQKASTSTVSATSTSSTKNQSIAGPKVVKTTFLKVSSSTPNASVAIDGILAGETNSIINTDPGQISIEVTAPGYLPKSLSVTILANRENMVTVNLDKPKPKTKPKPTPVPANLDQASAKRRTSSNNSKNRNQDDLFGTAPEAPPFPDATQTSTAASGVSPSAGNAVTEFERDSQTLNSPNPQAYTATTNYPPPSYPPQYYAPPVYTQPMPYYPPQPIYTPPPPPPLPTTPEILPGDDPAAVPGSSLNNFGKSATRRRTTTKPYKSMLLVLAPFGLGQFQNRDFISGSLIAAGQAATLYMWYENQTSATKVAKVANTFMQSTPQNRRTPDQEKWLESRKKEVKTYNDTASLWLNITAGIWAIGIVDAYINDPPPPKKKPRKRRRNPPLILEHSETEDNVLAVRKNPTQSQWQISFGLLPTSLVDKHGQSKFARWPSASLQFAWQH